MSKLAQSRTGSVSKRPSVLKSKHKEKEGSKSTTAVLDSESQPKQRNGPKPPIRPVSCFPKMNSENGKQSNNEGLQLNSPVSYSEQDVPPRPKQRPVSMTITTTKDPSYETSKAEDDALPVANVDEMNSSREDIFEAPKPPPRRPRPIAATKDVDEYEKSEDNFESQDLYTTIDETAKVAPKRRESDSVEDKIRPPLPPRKLTDKALCFDQESDSCLKTAFVECEPSSSDSSIVVGSLENPDGFASHDVEGQTASNLEISTVPEDDENSSDALPAVDNNSPVPYDSSDLYAVVNKPRSAKASFKSSSSYPGLVDVPSPGSSAPPLPPRTTEKIIKKAPPLPPRPNVE